VQSGKCKDNHRGKEDLDKAQKRPNRVLYWRKVSELEEEGTNLGGRNALHQTSGGGKKTQGQKIWDGSKVREKREHGGI